MSIMFDSYNQTASESITSDNSASDHTTRLTNNTSPHPPAGRNLYQQKTPVASTTTATTNHRNIYQQTSVAPNSTATTNHNDTPHDDIDHSSDKKPSQRVDVRAIPSSAPSKTHDSKEEVDPVGREQAFIIAFMAVVFPMLAIALILLCLVFVSHETFDFQKNSADFLPASPDQPPGNAFYTHVDVSAFTLASSWASTLAGLLTAPFMLLFSVIVAREIVRQPQEAATKSGPVELLQEILTGTWTGAWHWFEYMMQRKSTKPVGQEAEISNQSHDIRALNIAFLGLLSAGLLSGLVIAGDNWLHLSVTRVEHLYSGKIVWNPSSSLVPEDYQGGYTLTSACNATLTTPLPVNISTAPFPCSLNTTDQLLNLANAPLVYLTLDEGILEQSSDLGDAGLDSDEEAPDQIVTLTPPIAPGSEGFNLSHSFLFNIYATQNNNSVDGEVGNGVNDYIANTVSMATQCTFKTQACHLTNASSTDQKLSIPFNCYPDFTGDLGQTPANGLERVPGLNMSFYELVNGVPENIPIQAQSNPFSFYAAVAVRSIPFEDLVGDPDTIQGDVVDAGNGRIAFVLDCQATIYDVKFSVVNNNVTNYTATLSSPAKAAIIKAPLQVGFGQYNLFQQASIAVLSQTGSGLLESMGEAFSQTGVALASGVFLPQQNLAIRPQYTELITSVPKAPFLYVVSACLLYSALGVAMMVGAINLRRLERVREAQEKLMPSVLGSEYTLTLKKLVRRGMTDIEKDIR